MGYPITLIQDPGPGQAVATAARQVLDATGVALDWHLVTLEAATTEDAEAALPWAPVLQALGATPVVLKGPLPTLSARGAATLNQALRRHLQLYAQVCPWPRRSDSPGDGCQRDPVILHDLTADLSPPIEFERTTLEAAEVRAFVSKLSGVPIRADAALRVTATSVLGSHQILNFACRYAQAHGHHQVTVAHQAEDWPSTDGLFLAVAQAVAQDYPDLRLVDQPLDDLGMQLFRHPDRYDLVVMPSAPGNLLLHGYAGLLAGGIPSAQMGDDYAVFAAFPDGGGTTEPLCPLALIRAGGLLLQHLGETAAAASLQAAIQAVLDTAPAAPPTPAAIAAALGAALT